MKILVTGGAGFIGSNFVRYWREKYPKDEIRILDKLTYAGHKVSLYGIKNIEFIKGDICVAKDVAVAMKNIDVVVHFAAESHVDRSIIGPAVFVNTNVLGTQVLLEEAVAQKVKLFHYVNTDEVFGSLPFSKPKLKFNENTPFNPHSPYSATKASASHLVHAWHDTYGLPVTESNTSNNYGPYHDPEKLIPRFITNLLQNKKIPLMGKGENIRDWIHVEDHCRGIDVVVHAALKNPKLLGERFCIGGDVERTNLQVTTELLKLLHKDKSTIEYVEHRLGHDQRYAIDSTKIKGLGWKQKYTFEKGLAQTVRWYQDNDWWWKNLMKGRQTVDPRIQRRLLIERSHGTQNMVR